MEHQLRGGWRLTGSVVRATATAVLVALAAIALGRPDGLVLAAPLGLVAALGLGHAPRRPVRSRLVVADRWLVEGQATRLQVVVDDAHELEQVTTTLRVPAYVAAQPASGTRSVSVIGDRVVVEHLVSPRRWGVRPVGTSVLAATSTWGGFRWGPQRLPEATVTTLPESRAFADAENPHPVGLVGQHRSRRNGDGSEFATIRPFQPGDRLRRVNWRATARTGELHAVGTLAQEDSGLLLLLDASVDIGRSEGVDGRASTLDVGVRAASALAAHHLSIGDRVALRVLGPGGLVLSSGAGTRHQRRLQELLAQVQPGWPELVTPRQLRTQTVAGTVVVVLSPVLTAEVTTAMVALAQRGLSVVCVDTLLPGTAPEAALAAHTAAELAWRIRLVERGMQLTEVGRRGVPVVPWRGPGTLDEVLRQLSRRARAPRAVPR